MNRFHRVRTVCALLLLISVTALTACTQQPTIKISFAMGSTVTAKLYTENQDEANEISDKINAALGNTEKALSNTDKTAELYKLNESRVLYVSDYLRDILIDCLKICNITNRRLDISIGSVTSLWGFNTDTPSLPDSDAIADALKTVDISKIIMDPNSNKVTLQSSGAKIDLGAFGKGIACDDIYESIKYFGIPALISVGGTILAFDENPSGKKWSIGIRNPFEDENSFFARLELSPEYPVNAVYVSTSGSYEKSFTENGTDYHHILDPKTGYPVETDLVSVTVTASSGIVADALSTALFITGLNEDAQYYLELFDCEAVFVFNDKTYFVTEGLKNSIKDVDSQYTLSDFTFKNEK